MDLGYVLDIESTFVSTGFTLSSSFDNVNGSVTIMGNTPPWETPRDSIGNAGCEVNNVNQTRDISVAGFYGNMTMVKYRYEEFALIRSNTGKLIEMTDKYYVSMEINSLDVRNGHPENFHYFLGNVKVGHYSNIDNFTSTSFQNLPNATKYATAFAVLFSHISTVTGSNITGRYSGNYTIGPVNGSNQFVWSSIYEGVTIKSPNSSYYSTINSYISLGMVLAGVALAVAPALFADSVGDEVGAAGIIDALAGLGDITSAFFFMAVVSVQSILTVYEIVIGNSHNSNVYLQYFLVINAIKTGSYTLDVQMAYFLIE